MKKSNNGGRRQKIKKTHILLTVGLARILQNRALTDLYLLSAQAHMQAIKLSLKTTRALWLVQNRDTHLLAGIALCVLSSYSESDVLISYLSLGLIQGADFCLYRPSWPGPKVPIFALGAGDLLTGGSITDLDMSDTSLTLPRSTNYSGIQ